MIATYTKEQTAFRFDKDILASMKARAASLGRSLNNYVNHLVMEDLKSSMQLPKVSVADELDADVAKFAGIMASPTEDDLKNDERLAAIWNR